MLAKNINDLLGREVTNKEDMVIGKIGGNFPEGK